MEQLSVHRCAVAEVQQLRPMSFKLPKQTINLAAKVDVHEYLDPWREQLRCSGLFQTTRGLPLKTDPPISGSCLQPLSDSIRPCRTLARPRSNLIKAIKPMRDPGRTLRSLGRWLPKSRASRQGPLSLYPQSVYFSQSSCVVCQIVQMSLDL